MTLLHTFIQKIVRGLFFMLWALGLLLILATPVLRTAHDGISDPNDPYGSLLLAFSATNYSDHPYFYADLRASYYALLENVPETTPIYQVYLDDPEINDELRLKFLGRSWIWAYPRTVNTVTVEEVPDGATLIVSGHGDLPQWDCLNGEEGLRLCHSSHS